MKFRIVAREIHVQKYEVEADTLREAVRLFNDGDGNCLDGAIEYSHLDSIASVTDETGGKTIEGDELEELEKEDDPMTTYRVTWEIDIDAQTPRKAAERAQRMMRDP